LSRRPSTSQFDQALIFVAIDLADDVFVTAGGDSRHRSHTSSAAKRCRLARAMLSGEGAADFLPAIVSNSAINKTRSIARSSGHDRHFSTSVKWR
jgi:hypothetical protein